MYPVDAGFTVLLCLMLAVLIPVMAVMYSIANWILYRRASRKADRYIKRVMGE